MRQGIHWIGNATAGRPGRVQHAWGLWMKGIAARWSACSRRTIRGLAMASILPLASQAQVYVPLAATGYNYDVIAESTDYPHSTEIALDGSGYVLYTRALALANNWSGGLPNDGLIDTRYQLQNANGKNALMITPGQSLSLVPATPTSLRAISLLGFSTEGNSTASVFVHFQDGTHQNFAAQTMPDWYGSGNVVLQGFGRVSRNGDAPAQGAPSYPRMFALNNILDCANGSKLVDRIDVTSSAGNFPSSRLIVLGISAAPADVSLAPITGKTSIVVGETVQLTSAPTGGTWSSSASGIASVDASGGMVTGVTAGLSTISYSTAQTCGTTLVSTDVSVTPAATTTLVTVPGPLVAGQGADIGVSVSANAPSNAMPKGTVQVSLGTQTCTAVLSNGAGSCQIVPAASGSATLKASFGAGANFLGSNVSISAIVASAIAFNATSAPVPTLGQWGLTLLSLALAGLAAIGLHRSRVD